VTGDPALFSLAQAAMALRDGVVGARALTEACLDRIDRLQPHLNAFLTVDAEGAMAAADAADARRAQGRARGPLDGIPVAHKDLFHRAGRVTTAGSIILRGAPAAETATVLTRLNAAGAVELGTLNLSEFAAGATGHNRHYGDCRNPWDLERTPGGSSSGCGAAVAARLVFGALGSDTGGSIRIPAYGRVSRFGVVPRSWSADTVGPLTRTVEDAALLLGAVAGPDPDDPSAEAVPVDDYTAGLETPLRGRRIGVPFNYFFDLVEDGVRARLDAALDVFRGLGAELVDCAVPDPETPFRLAQIVAKAEAAAIHGAWIRTRAKDYDHGIREEMEAGLLISAEQYLQALRHRGPILQRWLDGPLAQVDLLLTPVYEYATPTMAACAPTSGEAAARIMATFGRCTRPISYLGLPALSVPCGFQDDGLPCAFQLVARPFAEALVLNAGHLYQRATGWHDRMPALAEPAAEEAPA
jgi:aspartyl-tRNA(Asn)/glutamyl-tRNA(Gln) amidotransferase subunit A